MAELNLRSAAFNGLRRIHGRVTDAEYQRDPVDAEQQLRTLELQFQRFVTSHDKLLAEADAAEFAEHEALWVSAEDLYSEARVALDRIRVVVVPREADASSIHSATAHRVTDIRLDPLAIPSFDGALQNWLAFKDTFETLVHDQDFPEAYKLGKLRQSVKADAVPLVGGLYSGGYSEVWNALKQRYDSPRQLADIHVSRFTNLPKVMHESPSVLLGIVDTVRESLRALRVMNLPVESWDAITVPILVRKLPETTQHEWGMTLVTNDIPELETLLRFLERRALSLPTEPLPSTSRGALSTGQIASRRSNTPVAQRTIRANLAVAETVSRCPYCSGPHRVTRCRKLEVCSPARRFDELRNSGLCFNCLKPGHLVRDCPSGGCHHCGARHHSMFCRAAANPMQDGAHQREQQRSSSSPVKESMDNVNGAQSSQQ